jgi:hypothetical protein
MALIIAGYLKRVDLIVDKKEEASNVYLEVPKANLSEAYDLPDWTLLLGELLKIEGYEVSEKDKAILKELEEEKIEFFMHRLLLGSFDLLLLSRKSWAIFRDYSILPDMLYKITVKLIEAKIKDKTVPIYPKRDVFVG